MGTKELDFRRPKIAWFSCDTNISHVYGKKTTGKKKGAQNIL
jgi:hypothetical protein